MFFNFVISLRTRVHIMSVESGVRTQNVHARTQTLKHAHTYTLTHTHPRQASLE